nr:MAG TPA: Protein transport protein SEC31 [Caudoviricetes sp.]
MINGGWGDLPLTVFEVHAVTVRIFSREKLKKEIENGI